MQSFSSKIWTRIAVSISCNDNQFLLNKEVGETAQDCEAAKGKLPSKKLA